MSRPSYEKRRPAREEDDKDYPSLFDVSKTEVAKAKGDRLAAQQLGELAAWATTVWHAQQVPASAKNPRAQQWQNVHDKVRTQNNRYSMMLRLNQHIRGPVQMRESQPEQPGLLTRLKAQEVPYTQNMGIFDGSGNEVQGWHLGEVIRPWEAATKANGRNKGVAPDRFGLVLQENGDILEYRLERGEGATRYEHRDGEAGLHNFRTVSKYDVDAEMPPSFISGGEEIEAWNKALENGIYGLAKQADEYAYAAEIYALMMESSEESSSPTPDHPAEVPDGPPPSLIPDAPPGMMYGTPTLGMQDTPMGLIPEIQPRLIPAPPTPPSGPPAA